MTRCSHKESLIFIISAPSGTGKSSLIQALLNIDPTLSLSISNTTRAPRAGEIDGADYHFNTLAEFEKLVNENVLLEHTKTYDNYYGTTKQYVNNALSSGTDILFDIDWNGAKAIKDQKKFVILIFVLPPDLETLKRRLEDRALDTDEAIAKRLKEATNELQFAKYYDYIVMNDQFDKTVQQLYSIVTVERLKHDRTRNLNLFSSTSN